jgi:hypothetical protein
MFKEATGAGGKKEDETEQDPEALREAEEARLEELERRRQKFAKMEKERENVRQGIRDKVSLINFYQIIGHLFLNK